MAGWLLNLGNPQTVTAPAAASSWEAITPTVVVSSTTVLVSQFRQTFRGVFSRVFGRVN